MVAMCTHVMVGICLVIPAGSQIWKVNKIYQMITDQKFVLSYVVWLDGNITGKYSSLHKGDKMWVFEDLKA